MARNTIVINVDLKETRVALIEDGVIAELQIERAAHRSTVGNVVLGRVTRVLPGMQAAFIDVGQERAAFLHVEDLIRPKDFDAYLAGGAREDEKPTVPLTVAAESATPDKGANAATGTPSPAAASNEQEATPGARSRRRRGRRGRGRGEERARAEREAAAPAEERADSADDELASEGAPASEASDQAEVASGSDAPPVDESADEDFELDVDADDFRRDDSLFDESDIEFDDHAHESVASSAEYSDDDDDSDDDSDDDDSDDDSDNDSDSDDDDDSDDDSDSDDDDDSDNDDDDSDSDDDDDSDNDENAVVSEQLAPQLGNAPDLVAASAAEPVRPSRRSRTGRLTSASNSQLDTSASTANRADAKPLTDGAAEHGAAAANGSASEVPAGAEPAAAGTDGPSTAAAANGTSTDAISIPPDQVEVRSRRSGRKRRRRGGRGNGETNATDAGPAQAAASSPETEPTDGNKRSRRRRGRRGRRANGEEQRNSESAVSTSAARKIPARVSRSVPISEVVKEGDQVVVQISKEPIGTKGARVSSHISLPGRYVVYLPTVEHIGISKRIGNAKERARLRKTIEALKPPTGGLIVRTVAEGLTKKQLKSDVGYLIKVWSEVARKREAAKPQAILYEELDLVLKAARDLFTDGVEQIVIDDREQYGRLCRFVEMFMPGRVKDIRLYTGDEPIFDAYGIEDEIKRALSRKVPLPSGGSLIVDQAEALTAIDVNTGRYVGKGSKDLEETALKTNLEAVDEIAYQLRFRNIGGLVILDLIDMEKAENREKVWRTLEHKLAKDKAKTTINRISELGLIEMTRKRTRESLGRVMHEPCFYCDGTGHIQSRETIAYEILRQIRRDRMTLPGYSVRIHAHPAVTDFLKHEALDALQEAERRYMRRIELVPHQEYHIEQYDLQGR